MEFSVSDIMRRALQSIGNNLDFYAAITLLFFIIGAGLETLSYALKSQSFLLALLISLLGLAVYVKQAVVVHRSVILNEVGKWSKVFTWKSVDNQFLLITIILGLLYALLGFVVSLIFMPFLFMSGGMSAESDPGIMWPMLIVLLLSVGLIFSAICLMLPSRAVGKPLSMMDAFDLVKPVYFKVMVLMVVVPALTAYLFTYVFVADSLLLTLVVNLIYHLVLIFEITILSHTYEVLTADMDAESTVEIEG